MLWLRVLNVLALLLILAFIVYLVVVKGCSTLPPRPLTPTEQDEVEVNTVLGAINAVNVMSNILIAVPALALFFMGFPVEGVITMACAVFSILWHASGWMVFDVLDEVFAVLAFIVVTFGFLRIVQVRGLPEISSFYMILLIFALCSYAGAGALSPPDASGPTRFVIDRMVHALWHVCIGALFFLVVAELQRTPGLLANSALRETIRARDEGMRRRLARSESGSLGPSWSLTYGLFRDLVRPLKK